jgi:hypothetical protein
MSIASLLLSLLLWQQPAPPNEVGILTGVLRNASGLPAAGIRVSIMPVAEGIIIVPETDTLSNLTQTDSAGRYRLENVVPGRYLIVAGALNFPTFYPAGTESSQARAVEVSAGKTLDNLDFVINPRSALVTAAAGGGSGPTTPIMGKVRMDNGGPMPAYGRLMRLQLAGISSPIQDFDLISVPPSMVASGPTTAKMMNVPLGYWVKSITTENTDLTTTPFSFVQGKNYLIEVILTKTPPPGTPLGVTVSGHVRSPEFLRNTDPTLVLKNALIPQRSAAGTLLPIATRQGSLADVPVQADGSFEIHYVLPGRYALGYRVFEVAQSDITNLDFEDDPNGKFPTLLDTVPPRSIKGTVTVIDGPIPEFEVLLTALRGGSKSQTLKIAGKEFSLGLTEGEYRVSIPSLPQGYVVRSVTGGPFDLTEPFLVTAGGISDRITGKSIPSGIAVLLERR